MIHLALAMVAAWFSHGSPWLDLDPVELRAFEAEWRADPAGACRRPAAYEYLRVTGRVAGTPIDRLCPRFTLLSERGELVDFDFGRLFEVQYLVAGRGGGFASRFGHTMLRFVFCAPERRSVDAACRADDFEAVDVGFVAHTDTQTFSVLGGVTGRYPSWLTVTHDSDLRHRYVDEELRDLVAAPLKLDRESRRLLFALVVERHWSYEGRYRFFTNNCAEEVLRLIQASVPFNHPLVLDDPLVVRPRGLLDELRRVGLAGPEDFTWASRRPSLDQRVRALGTTPPIRSVARYVGAPAARRLAWAAQVGPGEPALGALEVVARRGARARLIKAAVNQLYHGRPPAACDLTRVHLITTLEKDAAALSPAAVKTVGAKDIPRADQVLSARGIAARRRALDADLNQIIGCFADRPTVRAARRELDVARDVARRLGEAAFD